MKLIGNEIEMLSLYVIQKYTVGFEKKSYPTWGRGGEGI
jgi:hypothetical protein